MIKLDRVRSPASIHGNFLGPKRRELTRQLLLRQRDIAAGLIDPATNKPVKHNFDSSIWKEAKDQLLSETHGKCAYCEAPTSSVAYGDVEHYRPKSVYWWLAYSVENFLASCAICNQKFKKDNFPIAGTLLKGPKVAKTSTSSVIDSLIEDANPDPITPSSITAFMSAHVAEGAMLVNPYYEDPSTYFIWRADDNIGEVELAAEPSRPNSERYLEAVESNYGLNRLELKQNRYFIYDAYRTHRMTATHPQVPTALRDENLAAIKRMTDPERPFAGMIRYFVKHDFP
jgi:uncharacterized protein (TIGR02646 family)